MSDPQTIDSDPNHLFPDFRERIEWVIAEASREAKGKFANFGGFRLFEGFRSQDRQLWLYGQGRPAVEPYGRRGKIVTKAKVSPYHNRGVAADIVPVTTAGAFSWDWPDELWGILAHCAAAEGLEPGARWASFPDKPHVQIPKRDLPKMLPAIAAWKQKVGLV